MNEQPKRKGVPVWIGLAALGAIAYCSTGRNVPVEPAAIEEPHPATLLAENASPIEPLAVTAVALEKAFDENEVAAQLKYGAQPLLITGKLKGIELDSEDNPSLRIDSGALLALNVSLPSAQRLEAAELKKGQTVIVTCSEIREMIGKPVVDQCFLSTN